MGDVVKGRSCILYVELGASFYPVACSKDLSLEITRDLLELAPKSSVDAREYEYGRYTGKMTGSGLTKILGAPDLLYSIFDLTNYQLTKQKALVKFSLEDPDGNLQVFECNTLIESISLAKSSSSISSHNYTLQITGPITLTYTPFVVGDFREDGTGTIRDIGDGDQRITA